MGIPTDLAEEVAGIGLPELEPPPPPEPPKPSGGGEKPEEDEDVDEVVEELKLSNLLLVKAMEPPEQQAERILRSVECRC